MNTSANLSMIRMGTYLGECLTHCNETLIIAPEKTTYSVTSNVQDPQNLDIIEEMDTQSSDWSELEALVDWRRFSTLPSTIGQPDAADQGGEWVEITSGGTAKRVDFEMNASVPEIDPLLRKLREVRIELSQKFR
jgi:hypothetical protein